MNNTSIPAEKRAPYKSGMFMLLVVLVGLFASISCIGVVVASNIP